MKKYTGHKGQEGVYQAIINEIPRFDRFYEVFAGSAAISSFLTVPAGAIFLNDISPTVCGNLQKAFSGSTVTNSCAIDLINSVPAVTDRIDVYFLDPPYLLSTKGNRNLYEFEMTDDEHLQLLLTVLAKVEKKFIIIHPKCEMYDTYLKDWRKKEIKIRYSQKTSIECIYMNFPEPEELHTYKYLGNGCHDRQRIKRKGDRWVKKLQALPVLERNYILERLK